jgi:glycosyltransferase involved in cell wall biosynthesis
MAARFARQKDHATLIRAVRKLVDSWWTGRLFLAGNGKGRIWKKCAKLVQRQGLGEYVCFLGFVNDMPELLSRCRVSVLSTHYEGLPLILAESMSAGCLVIASDAPGVSDIVTNNVNGHLFPIGDVECLFQLLKRAVDNPDGEQVFANKGREDVLEKFSKQRMAEKYNALCLALRQKIVNADDEACLH